MIAKVPPEPIPTVDPPAWVTHHEDYFPAVLPDGSIPIPLFGLRVVIALGTDGQRLYATQIDNEYEVSPVLLIGHLEAVKAELLHDYLNSRIERLS